jgi:hypothetical protein
MGVKVHIVTQLSFNSGAVAARDRQVQAQKFTVSA